MNKDIYLDIFHGAMEAFISFGIIQDTYDDLPTFMKWLSDKFDNGYVYNTALTAWYDFKGI